MFAVDLPKITDNGGIYYYLYTSLFVLLFYGWNLGEISNIRVIFTDINFYSICFMIDEYILIVLISIKVWFVLWWL